jgi:hypothetical protein
LVPIRSREYSNMTTKRAVSNGFDDISVVLVDQSSSDDVSAG